MKRSRAFILSEQLMTIMLQASFIIVLCASFYQLISFYTRTQQVLTARNHAERVISFMDEKIRNAGLGLWRCKSSSEIRGKLGSIQMLTTYPPNELNKGYKLPVALKWYGSGLVNDPNDIPLLSINQNSGDVLTVLYAKKDLSSGREYEVISAFKEAKTLKPVKSKWNGDYLKYVSEDLELLDTAKSDLVKKLFHFSLPEDIKSYALMEGAGVPMHMNKFINGGKLRLNVYDVPEAESRDIAAPAAGELLALNCMQMFVHTHDGERQFAYREIIADGTNKSGTGWYKTYNQEKGILDIYMEVDRDKNIFTLWVLASGGYDASMNNPRPDAWPKEANPQGDVKAGDNESTKETKAKKAWLDSDYRHHIVYVSRAQWKLNNIPQGFTNIPQGFTWN